jgi:hypothetical protein
MDSTRATRLDIGHANARAIRSTRVGVRSEFVSKVDRDLRWRTLNALVRAYDARLRELAEEIDCSS